MGSFTRMKIVPKPKYFRNFHFHHFILFAFDENLPI